jgi:hypothetical protein
MPRSSVAIFSGTITAIMMVLAIIVGGFTAGTVGNVADDPGPTTVVPAPPTVQPDSDGHGWID